MSENQKAGTTRMVSPKPKKEEILYMVTCVFSPSQYRSRYNRYFQFADYIATFSNVKLYTVEVAIGDQEFTVTDPYNPFHMQLRTDVPLWYKENALNILINSLPVCAKKIAWVDCDVQWDNPNWVSDTLSSLDKHPVIQMFSTWANLDENDESNFTPGNGFVKNWVHKTQAPGNMGFTGLAWAARRKTLKQLGGLIDFGILGSGDFYMANALIGINRGDANRINVDADPHLIDFVETINKAIDVWTKKAKIHVSENIGYVDGNIRHFFHGKKSQRGYDWRWTILHKYGHDPLADLAYDENGLIYVKNPHPGFFDDVQNYFDSRREDQGLTQEIQHLNNLVAAAE